MSTTGHGPCLDSWLYDPFCCDGIPDEDERTAEEQVLFEKLRGVAAGVLWRASGRRYGVCSIKVRPCRQNCSQSTFNNSGVRAYPWTPALVGGVWTNVRCSDSCTGGDCCSAGCKEVILPGPVHAVTEVAIDGVVLPSNSYRVDDHRKLVSHKKPSTLTGDFMVATAGVDPSATLTADIPATSVVVGVDLGGGVYGPATEFPFTGILRLVWRGIDCVNITYDGPNDAPLVTTRPGTTDNEAGDSWDWPVPGFNFVVDAPITSSGNDDDSSVIGTLVSGTAVTSNPNPGPLARNITVSPGTQMEFCPSQLKEFCWPACQNMGLPEGEAGTWSVTYDLGIPLDDGGKFAFSVYLCELWKLCTGVKCRLPLNVEGVFRTGVNIDFADANIDLLSGMRTGIPEVDAWLAGVNPDRLRQPAQVYSPDVPRHRVQTWPT